MSDEAIGQLLLFATGVVAGAIAMFTLFPKRGIARCRRCGASRSANFCAKCGQRAGTTPHPMEPALLPILMMTAAKSPGDVEAIKGILAKAQDAGVDPEGIYRLASCDMMVEGRRVWPPFELVQPPPHP